MTPGVRGYAGNLSPARAALSILSLLATALATAQQPLYVDVTAANLPAGIAGHCADTAVGDVDGDGDPDVVLVNEFETSFLLLNDGSGVFDDASERLSPAAHDSAEVELADLDGDGDLDLVLVSEDDEINELYLNDGGGRFSDASDRLPVGGVSNAIAVMDLDSDGDPDLLIGNFGPNVALLNDGDARFSVDGRWTNDLPTQDLELVDIEGDGDLDVVVANEGQNELFINEGGGRLVNATAERLPERLDETRKIKALDADSDGDMDLAVANVVLEQSLPRQDYLLLNDGDGFFSEAAGAIPAEERDHFTIQVTDLDGDGDTDILAPHSFGGGGRAGDYRVLLNDGTGRFSIAAAGSVLPETLAGNGLDVAVADLNGDGAQDLMICNRSAADDPSEAARAGGQALLLLGRPAR